jgi:CheY-like chemotaxis protein
LTSGNPKVYKKQINPENSIKEVIFRFKNACDAKNIAISILSPALNPDIKLYTDNELLSKTLYQLIDNAVKFTLKGSVVVGYERVENDVHFFVKDTGIGISVENLNQIFDNFIQEDGEITRRYEGSGLGLSIAKGITALLGGKIWVDSEKGKGSTFHFSIPCLEQTLENLTQKLISGHSGRGKQTILIAEDDDINYYYFKVLLTHDLIEIIHANNGLEAVELCQQHPEIELVLMDLKMVEMDGFEATRQIKAFRTDLPVIAITAYSESEDKRKALQAGCDEFLTKPVKKELLIKKLEEFGLFYHKPQ